MKTTLISLLLAACLLVVTQILHAGARVLFGATGDFGEFLSIFVLCMLCHETVEDWQKEKRP